MNANIQQIPEFSNGLNDIKVPRTIRHYPFSAGSLLEESFQDMP